LGTQRKVTRLSRAAAGGIVLGIYQNNEMSRSVEKNR